MKKEYFKPKVKVVRIQHAHAILSGSNVSLDTGSTGGGGHGDAKEEGVDDIGW